MNKNKKELIALLEHIIKDLKDKGVHVEDYNFQASNGVASKNTNGFLKHGWDGSGFLKLDITTNRPKVLDKFLKEQENI